MPPYYVIGPIQEAVMIYTFPDYYKEFQCTADKCEETCCAGWQIVIDKNSLAKYRNYRGPFLKEILKKVNWLSGTFRQDKERRCAFLNENNLCDLYLEKGEKGFCKTCRNYPRHIEEFENMREISLSVSCPEVARILMDRMEPVGFYSVEKEKEETYEDFDDLFFSVLEDAREVIINVLQNRELSLAERVLLVLGIGHDIQGRFNKEDLFSCGEVIEKYQGEKALAFVKDYLSKEETMAKAWTLGKELFEQLYELEVLREEWIGLLEETRILLFSKERKDYEKIQAEFAEWKENYGDSEETPIFDIHLEQLLVYFIFTYFSGSVYDGRIFAKVQMAVYCVWMIENLWMGRWLRNGKELERCEMTELLYRFSRELEHSDDNLEAVEKMLGKLWKL